MIEPREPITIAFAIQPTLAGKVRAACMGLWSADQLAERVFLAWLNGLPMPRKSIPPSIRLAIFKEWQTWQAQRRVVETGKTRHKDNRVHDFLAGIRRRYGLNLCRAVLYHWTWKFARGGEAALGDHIGSRRKDYSGDPIIVEVRRLMAADSALSMRAAHRQALETGSRMGWPKKSYGTVNRVIRGVFGREQRPLEWPAMGARMAIDRS